MSYREAPREPVLVCMGRTLLAIDRDLGSIHYTIEAAASIERIFRVGERVLAVAGRAVLCVDVASGKLVGQVDLDFVPQNGLVCGDDLVLASSALGGGATSAVVCLASDGTVRWRVTRQLEVTGFLSATVLVRGHGPDGAVRSETKSPTVDAHPAGIAYLDSVIQPDRTQ
jgi:hypothetical protein